MNSKLSASAKAFVPGNSSQKFNADAAEFVPHRQNVAPQGDSSASQMDGAFQMHNMYQPYLGLQHGSVYLPGLGASVNMPPPIPYPGGPMFPPQEFNTKYQGGAGNRGSGKRGGYDRNRSQNDSSNFNQSHTSGPSGPAQSGQQQPPHQQGQQQGQTQQQGQQGQQTQNGHPPPPRQPGSAPSSALQTFQPPPGGGEFQGGASTGAAVLPSPSLSPGVGPNLPPSILLQHQGGYGGQMGMAPNIQYMMMPLVYQSYPPPPGAGDVHAHAGGMSQGMPMGMSHMGPQQTGPMPYPVKQGFGGHEFQGQGGGHQEHHDRDRDRQGGGGRGRGGGGRKGKQNNHQLSSHNQQSPNQQSLHDSRPGTGKAHSQPQQPLTSNQGPAPAHGQRPPPPPPVASSSTGGGQQGGQAPAWKKSFAETVGQQQKDGQAAPKAEAASPSPSLSPHLLASSTTKDASPAAPSPPPPPPQPQQPQGPGAGPGAGPGRGKKKGAQNAPQPPASTRLTPQEPAPASASFLSSPLSMGAPSSLAEGVDDKPSSSTSAVTLPTPATPVDKEGWSTVGGSGKKSRSKSPVKGQQSKGASGEKEKEKEKDAEAKPSPAVSASASTPAGASSSPRQSSKAAGGKASVGSDEKKESFKEEEGAPQPSDAPKTWASRVKSSPPVATGPQAKKAPVKAAVIPPAPSAVQGQTKPATFAAAPKAAAGTTAAGSSAAASRSASTSRPSIEPVAGPSTVKESKPDTEAKPEDTPALAAKPAPAASEKSAASSAVAPAASKPQPLQQQQAGAKAKAKAQASAASPPSDASVSKKEDRPATAPAPSAPAPGQQQAQAQAGGRKLQSSSKREDEREKAEQVHAHEEKDKGHKEMPAASNAKQQADQSASSAPAPSSARPAPAITSTSTAAESKIEPTEATAPGSWAARAKLAASVPVTKAAVPSIAFKTAGTAKAKAKASVVSSSTPVVQITSTSSTIPATLPGLTDQPKPTPAPTANKTKSKEDNHDIEEAPAASGPSAATPGKDKKDEKEKDDSEWQQAPSKGKDNKPGRGGQRRDAPKGRASDRKQGGFEQGQGSGEVKDSSPTVAVAKEPSSNRDKERKEKEREKAPVPAPELPKTVVATASVASWSNRKAPVAAPTASPAAAAPAAVEKGVSPQKESLKIEGDKKDQLVSPKVKSASPAPVPASPRAAPVVVVATPLNQQKEKEKAAVTIPPVSAPRSPAPGPAKAPAVTLPAPAAAVPAAAKPPVVKPESPRPPAAAAVTANVESEKQREASKSPSRASSRPRSAQRSQSPSPSPSLRSPRKEKKAEPSSARAQSPEGSAAAVAAAVTKETRKEVPQASNSSSSSDRPTPAPCVYVYDIEFLKSFQSKSECTKEPDNHQIPDAIRKRAAVDPYVFKSGRGGPQQGGDRDRDRRTGGRDGRMGSRYDDNQGGGWRDRPDNSLRQTSGVDRQKTESSVNEPLKVGDDSWALQRKKKKEQSDKYDTVMRNTRSLLNKLTLEKFDTLYEQLLQVGIDQEQEIKDVTKMVFEKAVTQHHFIDMYATLCEKLSKDLKPTSAQAGDESEKMFKRILLTQCQDSFEEYQSIPETLKEKEKAWLAEKDNKAKEDDYIEAFFKYKKKMLGNIMFVAELMIRKMLSVKVFEPCVKDLKLVKPGEADERDAIDAKLETLCVLITKLGPKFDVPAKKDKESKYQAVFDETYKFFAEQCADAKTTPRIKCLMKDAIDLRASGYLKERPNAVSGPKKISEVHKEFREEEKKKAAESQRNAESTRGMNFQRGPQQQSYEGNSRFGYGGSSSSAALLKSGGKSDAKPEEADDVSKLIGGTKGGVSHLRPGGTGGAGSLRPGGLKKKEEKAAVEEKKEEKDVGYKLETLMSDMKEAFKLENGVNEWVSDVSSMGISSKHHVTMVKDLIGGVVNNTKVDQRQKGFQMLARMCCTTRDFEPSTLSNGIRKFMSEPDGFDLVVDDMPKLPGIITKELMGTLREEGVFDKVFTDSEIVEEIEAKCK